MNRGDVDLVSAAARVVKSTAHGTRPSLAAFPRARDAAIGKVWFDEATGVIRSAVHGELEPVFSRGVLVDYRRKRGSEAVVVQSEVPMAIATAVG